MPERRDAKLQMIAGPDFLLNGEQMAVIRLRIGQPGFQPALGFVLAEAMRNRDDQRLRHYGFQMVPDQAQVLYGEVIGMPPRRGAVNSSADNSLPLRGALTLAS